MSAWHTGASPAFSTESANPFPNNHLHKLFRRAQKLLLLTGAEFARLANDPSVAHISQDLPVVADMAVTNKVTRADSILGWHEWAPRHRIDSGLQGLRHRGATVLRANTCYVLRCYVLRANTCYVLRCYVQRANTCYVLRATCNVPTRATCYVLRAVPSTCAHVRRATCVTCRMPRATPATCSTESVARVGRSTY